MDMGIPIMKKKSSGANPFLAQTNQRLTFESLKVLQFSWKLNQRLTSQHYRD